MERRAEIEGALLVGRSIGWTTVVVLGEGTI
jgi:hypothetical protein